MRRPGPAAALLLVAALLAACPAKPPVGPTIKKSPGAATPKPGGSTTPKPGLSADPAAATGRAAIAKAAAGTRPIETTVRADAGWIIANNGGALISDNGIGAVRLGGSLISDNGIGLIANNGGNLVVADGQALIRAAGTLISDNGIGLVAKAKLISDNGIGIVANNGGGFVTRTRYALAQAGAPQLGTARPAASMVVGLIDPRTGEPVPVGVDDEGQPVYAVFSDGAGRVQLHVPPALAGNLRLVAFPPDGADTRLRFNAFVANGAAGADIDDDEAQVAGFLRGLMARRLATMYRQTITGEGGVQGSLIPPALAAKSPALAALAQPLADRMRVYLDAIGAAKATPRRLEALMLMLSDRMIADLDLPAIQIEAAGAGETSALATLRTAFKRIAEGAAVRLRESPRWFDDKPYVIEASRRRIARGAGAYAIRKPTDLTDMLAVEFMGSNLNTDFSRLSPALGDLGLPYDDVMRLKGAGEAVFLAIGSVLLTSETELEGRMVPFPDALEALARAQGPAVLAAPDGPLPAVDAVVPPEAPRPAIPVVSTLAGDGTAGATDGPGAAARFDGPASLALDGDRLLVQEQGGARLRAIALKDPAHPVTTLATIPGFGLAVDRAGRIFVSDDLGHRIHMIAPGQPPRVIAGTGAAGAQDGPGAAATFDDLYTLAIDPAGDLIAVEHQARRIRRVKLADPAFPVDTLLAITNPLLPRFGPPALMATGRLLGTLFDPAGRLMTFDTSHGQLRRLRADGTLELVVGLDASNYADGFYMTAEFRQPHALAYDARGRIVVADAFNHVLRMVAPTGDVTTWAGGPAIAARNTLLEGGFADGPGDKARFNEPTGVAIAPDGTVYVAERRGQRIRVVKPAD